MIFDDIRESLETHFRTQWAGRTPVGYKNVPYIPAPGEDWVEIRVNMAGAPQVGLPNRFRYAGVLQINIFVPKDAGTKPANDYADIIIPWYNGKQIGGITLKNPTFYDDDKTFPGWFMQALAWEIYKDNVGG